MSNHEGQYATVPLNYELTIVSLFLCPHKTLFPLTHCSPFPQMLDCQHRELSLPQSLQCPSQNGAVPDHEVPS